MDDQTRTRVLVTGGTGFLGSHIIEACLKRGDQVTALVRPGSDLTHLQSLKGLQIVRGDLHEPGSLDIATEHCDVVFHAAARVVEHGSLAQFQQTNVAGTQHLLASAQKNGVKRFVFVSSPSVTMSLGGSPQINANEGDPYPRRYYNFYAETKAAAERLVLAAHRPHFVTCAIRPRCVWGPRDMNGALTKLIRKMSQGRLANLSGGRRVMVSTCYCENAVHACLLAAEAEGSVVGGKTYFITDGSPVALWPFCADLAARFGLPAMHRSVAPGVVWLVASVFDFIWRIPWIHRRYAPPVSRYAAALVCQSSTFDITAAERDLGYSPVVDRETGLRETRPFLVEIGLLDGHPSGE